MKVSVCMITYNHEEFIAQAIDSVLMQKTNFDYELVIGEDCSTDNTRAIVRDYHKRYPERVRPLLHENNVGMRQNGQLTREACRGEYIAILEGDDYWTSADKLQKQVDYMDAHPECAISCHRAAVIHEGTGEDAFGAYWPRGEQPAVSGFVDVVTGCCEIPTCSAMLRRELLAKFPDWFMEMPIGDYPMFALCAQHGSVYYSSEVMAVYRRHPQGLTTSWEWNKSVLNRSQVCKCLLRTVDRRYHRAIRAVIGEQAYILAQGYESRGDFARARGHALARVLVGHYQSPLENPVRQYVRLLLPGLHRIAKGVSGKWRGRVRDA